MGEPAGGPGITGPPLAAPEGDGGRDDGGSGEEWDYRPRWRPRLVGWAVAVAILGAVIGFAYNWYEGQVNPPGDGAAVAVDVPKGATLSGMASALASKGVIGNATVFKIYLHFQGGETIHPGHYQLHRHEPYQAVLAALGKGPTTSRLVIPEGFTLGQIAVRVGQLPGHSSAHFLKVVTSGQVRSPYEPPGSSNLEGLVFPDTYVFPKQTSDKAIMQMMVDRFDAVAKSVGLPQAAKKVGVTPYQASIVASMVVREAKLPADRGKVARVIYNRLKAGMRLQVDATVIYALGGNVKALQGHNPAQVATKSPYNTYVVKGLPPTPIASPGKAALQAALNPTPGNWLYYVVVSKSGAEAFSNTYAGQQANIALAKSRGLR